MGIWVIDTSNHLFIWKSEAEKNAVTGKTPPFVIDPFCTFFLS